jgi:hypothetical protein
VLRSNCMPVIQIEWKLTTSSEVIREEEHAGTTIQAWFFLSWEWEKFTCVWKRVSVRFMKVMFALCTAAEATYTLLTYGLTPYLYKQCVTGIEHTFSRKHKIKDSECLLTNNTFLLGSKIWHLP